MPTEVVMPKVDMDMSHGRITAWHVAEGAAVKAGDELFDIETEKAAMGVESPASGIVRHVTASVGDEVPIGVPVAWIYADGEAEGPPPTDADARGAEPAATEAPSDASDAPAAEPCSEAPQASAESVDRIRATPAGRRLARERQVDLRRIAGSGRRGRIQRADVERVLEDTTSLPDSRSMDEEVPLAWEQASGELHVKRSGSGDRLPLLLIHGFASDLTGWAKLEDQLPRNREIIRIDLPGHGRSPRRSIADFRDLLRLVRQAFDDLGTDRVHLVGHSLGGAIALALADTRERRVASLTLIAPAGLGPEINGRALSGIAQAGQEESLGPWLRTLVFDPGIINGRFVAAAMAPRRDPALRAAQQAMARTLFPDETQSFDLTAALQRIAVPLRIIWGKCDNIIPWRHALRAPGRTALHLFAETGHLPHVERPKEVSTLLEVLA